MRELCENQKKLVGKYQQTNKPVKDKYGTAISSMQEQTNRWREYFIKLLNRPALKKIQAAEEDSPINCEKPSKDEIKKAIMLLQNGKAAGQYGIAAVEALKANIDTFIEILHRLLTRV